MKTTLLIFTAIVISGRLLGADEYRTFTDVKGRQIEARVEGVKAGQVKISMRDGRSFVIPFSTLSEPDQTFLREWVAASSAPEPLSDEGGVNVEAINELIGSPLFGDRSLWESSPSEVAGRMKWPQESKTQFSESYRAYPKASERLFGARPYSAALYGEDDKVTGISIVFANKGDSYSESGRGEEHFVKGKPVPGGMDGVRVLMEHDTEVITGKLSSLLGEAEEQKFGEGEARVRAKRWDWAGHAFLLSHVEDEYVGVTIQTIEFADNRGNSRRIPDSVIRERIRGLVEQRENGDVVISNIPMVDQGPKGYCAPATAERCMRFLGIPADMYLLAMAGETSAGGGTSVDRLLNNIGSDIKRKGRSFETETGELKLRDIKRRVRDGIPTMWTLYSTNQFNQIANDRTARRKTEDWATYVETVAAESKGNTLAKDRSTAHVVIIIGYNEETEEIAFSDSWGERYLERWITIEEAEQVSQGFFYVIDL